MEYRLNLPGIVVLALLIGGSVASAQYGGHDYTRIARPELSLEKKPRFDPEKYNWEKFVASGSINRESALFLNSNTIVETPNNQFPQNESSIAISPLDPEFLIASAVDSRAGAWVYISRDGGESWTNVSLGVVNSDWQSGNDPSVGFDRNGVAYVMYGAFPRPTTGESGVYIARSTDNGETWQAHIPVIEHRGEMTSDSAFEDKYYIEIDLSPVSPYVDWMYTPWKRVTDRDSATEIVFSRSTDGGDTWSVPVGISPRRPGTSTHITFGQSFPLVKTGPEGEIYAVWNDGPARSIGFNRSTDGGSTWSTPTYPVSGYEYLGTDRYLTVTRAVIDTIDQGGSNERYDTTEVVDTTDRYHVLKETFRAETYPTITVDNTEGPRRGTIYLCWSADRNPNVYFSRSTDHGDTWSTPVIVHSVLDNDQWWPWISLDETNGDIAVMYSDSRHDPENILIDTYVSYSSDGGDTWIDRRATDAMSDFRDNPFVDNVFAGDYSGNAFHDGIVYPSFLDTRDDNDVYTAIVDTRAPLPVDSLRVGSDFNRLTEATLTWIDPPLESTFGRPITDFTVEVLRDGLLIAELDPGTERLVDTGRIIDTEYLYEAVVVADDRRSAVRDVTFTAGAARLPLPPMISTVDQYRPTLAIRLLLPSHRADSVTPLENLDSLLVYRDGTLLLGVDVESAEAGDPIALEDTPEQGYYRYHFVAIDEEGNRSDPSDTVVLYSGTTEGFQLTDDRPYRLLLGGEWAYTDEIAFTGTLSLTDRPNADYQPRTSSSAQLYPLHNSSAILGWWISFRHIALVRSNDTAVLEYSLDTGRTWTEVASWSAQDHDVWEDGELREDDWKEERLLVIVPDDSLAIVRFTLSTGIFGNDRGWFIDDITAQPDGNSVPDARDADRPLDFSIYPTPGPTVPLLQLRSPDGGEVSIQVVDQFGRVVDAVGPAVVRLGSDEYQTVRIESTEQLPVGTYYFVLEHGGTRTAQKFIVIR